MIHFIHNRGITLLNQIVEAIDDSFEKIVVSLDDIAQPSRGGIRSLGEVEKIYLDNTNLAYDLGATTTNIGNIRETFFFNQMRLNHDPISSPVSDFIIDDMTFEVGGRNKKQKQIENAKNAYVVKDDIETGYMNVIPLWQLGLEY
jgi:uncharacterized protein